METNKYNYQVCYKMGLMFESKIKNKYGLINEFKKNHKWDAYGNNNIKIQIKFHKEDTDIILGSYNNYSYMEEDFILIIGEHKYENREIVDIDINDIKISTYYIDYIKWNECFINKKFNKNHIKIINKKKQQEIENNKNSYYIIYGNYNDKCFTKIKIRLRERNDRKSKIEKCWTISIKKEKINDFFKMFEKTNIIDYSELHLFNNIII